MGAHNHLIWSEPQAKLNPRYNQRKWTDFNPDLIYSKNLTNIGRSGPLVIDWDSYYSIMRHYMELWSLARYKIANFGKSFAI